MWQFALIYLDDTIIFSMTLEKHTDRFQQVLTLQKRWGATLELKTDFSSQTHLIFLDT